MAAVYGYPGVVLSPVFGLAAYAISQIMIARNTPGRSPYFSLSRGFLCGLVTMLTITAVGIRMMRVPISDAIGFALLNTGTFLALAFGYFNFVNLTVASLRIRLLEELLDAGGRLSAHELRAAYNVGLVSSLRIDRLVRGGHLVEQDGRLVIGRKRFLVVARIFDFLYWFIIGCGRSQNHA